MKKLLGIFCATALVMCMSITAFAAPTLPATGTNSDVTLNTGSEISDTQDIPVYGYVGPDATIVDPGVDDPAVPPTVTPTGTDIVVSVPVKLMWASFASSGGTVTSPTYTIENKSLFAVNVELTSFTQTSVANTTKDAQILLDLVGLGTNWETASNVVGMSTPISAGTLTASTGVAASKTFNIGGTYDGSYTAAYQPIYTMVLTFSIA